MTRSAFLLNVARISARRACQYRRFSLHSYPNMERQEYSEDLVNCLKGYFDCPSFSDVTIRAQVKDFYAHRLVLASQSAFFADALHKLDETPSSPSSKIAEPETPTGVPVLDLTKESSLVVEGVLFFLYNADYEDGSPAQTPEIMGFNLLMSAAADKYSIPSLKECALAKLDTAAREFWDTCCFLKALRHAFKKDSPAHNLDRAVLTLVAVDHVAELMEKTEFVELLRGNHQFQVEFEDAVAENERTAQDWSPCMYCNRRHDPSECAHIWSG
ncbi:hypothetical protein NCS52_00967800 [Fusarium sp. LHS14.1]|nr:hypothetical protein NCS52_00967800 [Fusarium sp. LHS14.1]